MNQLQRAQAIEKARGGGLRERPGKKGGRGEKFYAAFNPYGSGCFRRRRFKAFGAQGENVVGVITVPDRNGQATNPLKELAVQLHLPLIQPSKLKDPEALAWVARLQPDLLVLA